MAESRANSKRDWSRSIGAIAVIVLALLMLVGFVMLFGAVRGEEFSPATFSRRSFVFYRIPLLRIQITPVMRSATTNALETHLSTKLFADNDATAEPTAASKSAAPHDDSADRQRTRTSAATPQRWDVVRLAPLSRTPEFGSAYCLCAYLDRNQGGKLKWLTWTNAHPQLAQVLWPTVRQAAMDRLYYCVPDLMAAAEQAATLGTVPEVLKKELAQISSQAAILRDRAVGSDDRTRQVTE